MGIKRSVEWLLVVAPEAAEEQIFAAVRAAGMEAERAPGSVRATSARSLLKNRWAAELAFDIEASNGGSAVLGRVEMNGDKHFVLLDEIAESLGDDVFDDRGLHEAIERLGKASRLFGRKEVNHLHHHLRAAERVRALGQGTYAKKQGLVVLTTERLFFFEKSIGSETVEEFAINAVSSLEVAKKRTGERLVIHASGNRAEITNVMHGQADEIARAFRAVKAQPSTPVAPAAASPPDVLAQLEKLGSLRDAGILTEDEFVAKKAALLDRL